MDEAAWIGNGWFQFSVLMFHLMNTKREKGVQECK